MTLINNYENNGYVIVKNVFSKEFCNLVKKSTVELKSKLTLPFSKVPYGFGDLRNINPFNKISESELIQNYANQLIGGETKLSHFMLVNKAAWIGPDVEWHQEVFNLQIYAPGCSADKDWKRFLQVFIAIDKHEKLNGCLKVFKGSHKAGVLDYEDIMNLNCSHKRRVKPEVLDELVKSYEIIDVEMEEGDALFFNHLLVHGSPSNLSANSRLSALLQYYDKDLSFEGKNFNEYSSFRANFVADWLKSSLSKVDHYKQSLSDFKKD